MKAIPDKNSPIEARMVHFMKFSQNLFTRK